MAQLNQIAEYQPTNNVSSENRNPFFSPLPIQKKLEIGSADDAYEIEADRVADQVVGMSEVSVPAQSGALVQRKCTTCDQEEQIQKKPLATTITSLIQRSAQMGSEGGTASEGVTSQINSTRGSGQSMNSSTKGYMESRFGTDFSGVRIHTGSKAIQLSSQLNAQAFTVGNDIYFNEGKYNPNSHTGKHLLAHELTHTIQQGGIQRKMIQMDRLQCTSRKTIDVYIVDLPGAGGSLSSDIAYANNILCQCGIKLNVVGGESWQTNLLDLESPNGSLNHDPRTLNQEVVQMTAHRPGGDVIHIYNIPAHFWGARGGSYGYRGLFPQLPPSVFITSAKASDTLAHEMGHVLLQNGGHHPDPDNLMATGNTRNVGVGELTTQQCALMP